MSIRALLIAPLAGVLLVLILAQRDTIQVAAQIPSPSGALSVVAIESTDAHGVVVSWSLAAETPAADFFLIYRRSIKSLPGSDVQVAVVMGTTRGYTDYTVEDVGIWCYQVVSVVNTVPTFASPENCVGFLAGLPGAVSPVLAAGCSRFYQTRPAGTLMAAIAAKFDPAAALVSLWRFDPDQQRLVSGYFADPNVPVDFVALPASNEYEFACLTTTATYR
jgi:hypothetical protein